MHASVLPCAVGRLVDGACEAVSNAIGSHELFRFCHQAITIPIGLADHIASLHRDWLCSSTRVYTMLGTVDMEPHYVILDGMPWSDQSPDKMGSNIYQIGSSMYAYDYDERVHTGTYYIETSSARASFKRRRRTSSQVLQTQTLLTTSTALPSPLASHPTSSSTSMRTTTALCNASTMQANYHFPVHCSAHSTEATDCKEGECETDSINEDIVEYIDWGRVRQ